MEHRLSLFHGNEFLGGRAVAFHVRTTAEELLRADRDALVVLDFQHVVGISHSCADELLSPLSELGASLRSRVVIEHCSAEVYGDLASVARMHELHMPSRRDLRAYA
jgi:hypothetical protein